jgi:hypothetical protein
VPRIVAIVTALMWSLILLASFAAAGFEGAISFHTPMALIGDAIAVGIVGVVVSSVWFACRPRRWLAVLLLLVSVVPAGLSVYALWSHISFYRTFPVEFRSAFWLEAPWFCGAVIFATLAVLWAMISLRVRDVPPTT